MIFQQELPIPAAVVWNQWRSYKMSDEDCFKDLVRSRDRSAVSCLQQLEYLIKRSRMLEVQDEIARVQAMLEAGLSKPRPHPVVTQFMSQWLPEFYGRRPRSKCLLFRGSTRQGKSTMAMTLFGGTKTLKLSCQGLPRGILPGLHKFTRDIECVVWDEIRPDQILANRELFQSNQFEQVLSQSACMQHSYGVWVYFVAMVLCANDFPFEGGDLTEEDTKWLRANIFEAELAPGETWYLDS